MFAVTYYAVRPYGTEGSWEQEMDEEHRVFQAVGCVKRTFYRNESGILWCISRTLRNSFRDMPLLFIIG